MAFCALFLSAAFGAPDIRVTPLSINLNRTANPQIYIEIDWMDGVGHSHKPSQAVIDRIVAAFARDGFDIHIDVSNAIPHQDVLAVVNTPSSSPAVVAIRDAHFNHINDSRYYYSIWCHNYSYNGAASTSSGIGDLPGRIHLVSLGSFSGQTGTANDQVGTFIHEFGHNINQKHGGDDHSNYKPNYMSVMNYHFQLGGIGPTLFALGLANSSAGWNDFGYSHGTLPDLDENHLNETVGIGLGRAVDWNGDGDTTDTDIAHDLNARTWTSATGSRTIIKDFDNWGGTISQIRNGILMPNLAIPAGPAQQCIAADEAVKQKAHIEAMLATRGLDPALAVGPAAVQPLNGFTIFNDGDQPLVVSSITPQTAAPWLSLSPTLPMTIPAGSSRTVAVAANFNLAPNGSTTTRLLVASNDPDENPYPGGVNVTVNQAPNLTPYQPGGWSDKIVISTVTGTTTDSATLLSTDTLYLDFAVINNGAAAYEAGGVTELYVDGVLRTTFTDVRLDPNIYEFWKDQNLGNLLPGTHTLRIKADAGGVLTELFENDNEYTKTIFVNAANNNFASAQTLTGSSGTMTGGNAGATKEAGEPSHAGNVGGRSVWFQWTAPITGLAAFDTLTSPFDTLLAVYTGGSVGSLTGVASNDNDPAGGTTSKVTFNAVAGTVYRIAVDGFNGATGVITLHYSVVPVLPVITSPTTASATSGQAFNYQIVASNGPTSYNATGLPAGLSVNTGSGLISGTPTAVGTFNVTLSAINASGPGTANLALTVASPAFIGFALDTDPGWTRTGEWAFGTPTGAGGPPNGNPDPTAGATGTKVFGVNLSGNYSTGVAGPYYLTAGPLNFTGRTSSTLRFKRWLNSDFQPYVFATIEVSTNGTTWTSIWNNGTSAIADSAWQQVTHDISALADNQPTVYVRWGYQVAANAFAYSGWNIDDVEFLGTPPAPVISSAGTASGTTGQPFSYQIVATNSPTSYNATGLPAGLSINTSTGLISGTPTGAGISAINLSATNAGGTGIKVLTLTVYSIPAITSPATASGTTGQAFSYQIVASNSPTSYNATGLPAGLNVNTSTGLISGTLGGIATSNVTLSATNPGGTGTASLSLTVNPPAFLALPLDTDPGWTKTGEWAFGTPTGAGGASYGNPDPSAGATGTKVFGVNLNGDYSTAVSGPHYLTAGPFDFTGRTSSKLRFQRWLNTDYQNYVFATIEVSTNGTTWTSIWNNGVSSITDSAWTQVHYDLAALADNQPTVYVRWGYQVAANAFAYSGWNIDDVAFLGVTTAPVITSAGTISGTIGQPFSYQIVGSNNPTSYNATGLPPGLTVNPSNGLISGTPTALGTSNVTLSATNAGGAGTANLVLTVDPLTLASFPLDTDPGWTKTGEWAFGTPTGAGGTSYGRPDPAAGATGTKVFGVNLSGDYSTAVAGPHFLTAGPFNFSGRTSSTLRFQRWLNTDYQPYVFATIEVSTNGTTWTSIWDNGDAEIADSAWTKVQYNIAALADNQPTVYIRWGYQVASGAFAYSGWNIDDVEFLGVTAPPVITSALTASGNTGQAFSYQIVSTNSPTSYAATGLPAGLSVNTSTGVISGAPTAVGVSTINLSVTNAAGTDAKVLTLTVTPPTNVVVLNNADSGAGSLRQAIADIAAGGTITFAPGFTGPIVLTSEIVIGSSVTVDASAIAAGVTIDVGAGTNRIFSVSASRSLALKKLTLTGGNGVGATASGTAGAIYNVGTLALTDCTVTGNASAAATRAGAIYSNGVGSSTTALRCVFSNNTAGGNNGGGAIYADTSTVLDCTDCTFSGNTSGSTGGAIHVITAGTTGTLTRCTFNGNGGPTCGDGGAVRCTSATLTLVSSTFFGNTCTSQGGAVFAPGGTVVVRHCTIAGNTGVTGGGIRTSAAFTLENSIVAGNTATTGPDISLGGGTLTRAGACVVGINTSVTAAFPTGAPHANGSYAGTAAAPVLAQLAALANYGGLTQTMALLPGSPARERSIGSAATSDQRGFPIFGTADIGAYETGVAADYATWSIENFGAATLFTSDTNGDSIRNGLEYALRRDALPFSQNFAPMLAGTPGARTFAFRYRAAARDLRYIVERTSDLANVNGWTEIYRYNSSTGVIDELLSATGDENPATQIITLTDPATGPRLFWRLRTEPVP